MTTEQRSDEFQELEAVAKRYLRHSESIPSAESLADCEPQLRLWHYTALEAWTSWLVVRDRKTESLRLRQVTWDRSTDQARFLGDPATGLREGFHTSPSIEVRDRDLPREDFHDRMAKLRTMSFIIGSEDSGVGLHGETFGLQIGLFMNDLRISWWDDGPDAWREVTVWTDETKLAH